MSTMTPNVTVIATEDFQALIASMEDLKLTVMSTIGELKEARKPYLSTQELMELTGFGSTWVVKNKHLIGFSDINGTLRFKRKDVEEFMEENYSKTKIRK